MRRLLAACMLVGCAAAACTFGPLPLGPGGDAGGAPDSALDAGSADGPTNDARPCPEGIVAEADVNGGSTPITVLVGDTVRFTAGASCVKHGPPTFTWTLSPADGTLLTKRGTDEDFTVYSVVANQTYVVSLEVRDATGDFQTVTFQAFSTVGFSRLDGALTGNDLDTRGIDVGDGSLFMATAEHAWQMPLDDPGGFIDITDGWGGLDKPDGDLGDVYFEPAESRVWIGGAGSIEVVWRGSTVTRAWDAIHYDGVAALGASATVHDIAAAPLGIYLGTNQGVTQALTGDTFVGVIRPETMHAVLTTASHAWAGGRHLWDLLDPSIDLSPWGVTDNKLRAMGPDLDGRVWITSDDEGIARLDGTTGANLATFTMSNGLGSNSVKSVACETSGAAAGDVWFATTAGISRWKRDRDQMITLAAPAGLTGRLSGREIRFTVFAGARTIYESTTNGLVYAHLP